MKKYAILLLLTALFASNAYSQLKEHASHQEFQIRVFTKVGMSYNTVRYPKAVGAGVLSLDVDLIKSNYEKFGYQVSHRWPIMGDFLFPGIMEVLGFIKSYDDTPGLMGRLGSTSLTCLLLGWHNHAWSLYSSDRINIAGGFHWGDYSYSFREYEESARFFRNSPLRFSDIESDPSGYFLGYGPTVIADFSVSSNIIIHYEGAYAFTARLMEADDDMAPQVSPNPRFLNQQLEVRYNKLFIGLEYCNALKNQEADHYGRRLAFILGIGF